MFSKIIINITVITERMDRSAYNTYYKPSYNTAGVDKAVREYINNLTIDAGVAL